MNKLLFGAAAAAGSFLAIAPSVEAHAQTTEQCATVYDETLAGDSSGELRNIIGKYATHGVEVHVQIFQDTNDDNITSAGDAENYIKRLNQTCGWQDPDRIDVFISDSPHLFSIYKVGQAEQYLSQQRINDAKAQLPADLRDTSTNHQTDVAKLLTRIDPYNAQPITATPNNQNRIVNHESGNGPDIPVKEILEGLAGLLILGAAGYRTKVGIEAKHEISGSREQAETSKADMTEAIMAADSQLSVLPEDDAKELRDKLAHAQEVLVKVTEQSEAAMNIYNEQKRRIRPDFFAVQDAADELEAASENAQKASTELSDEAAQVNEFITNIQNLFGTYSERVAGLMAMAGTAKEHGWDLTAYDEKIYRFNQTLDDVKLLREKNYIEKPAEIMAEQDPQITEFMTNLEVLDERRAMADDAHHAQETEIADYTNTVDQSLRLLNSLRGEYDPSCYGDIDHVETDMNALLTKLRTIHDSANGLVGIKSVTSLDQHEAIIKDFTEHKEKIGALVETIANRNQKLTEVKENLQDDLQQMTEDLQKARQYAFNTYNDDVEEDTRHEIEQLEQEFEEFKHGQTGVSKPKYLEIDKKTETFQTSIKSAQSRATTEKEEMDRLRNDVQHLESKAESELNGLRSYVSSHGSDTNVSSGGFSIFSANPNTNRSELRGQVERFESIISSIQSAESEAKRDVQRAEDERERQRRQHEEEERRRRQQQEDDERRRQASISSFTSSSSSSSFDSGSFGGGSSSGGSFDSGSW